jgi:exopolyphosphatase / guanosine-5'-triphosphate,3'-diphosphate pyrophosphatase
MTRRVAVADVGTNSVLYLLAERNPHGTIRAVFQRTESTRLGRGLQGTGIIGEKPLEKTISVLREYKALAESHGAGKLKTVGTHLFRAARNSGEVLRSIEKECGIAVEVLSENAEAEWSYRGAVHGRSLAETAVVVDIGGGSTEAVLGRGGMIVQAGSLPLGSVSLTERFLRHEPFERAELDALEAFVLEAVMQGFGSFIPKGKSCVAVGGTATTLAALDRGLVKYDADVVDGTFLNEAAVVRHMHGLAAVPLEERKRMVPFDTARADILVAGIFLLHAVMKAGRFCRVLVSDRGLRFGIALREFHSHPA